MIHDFHGCVKEGTVFVGALLPEANNAFSKDPIGPFDLPSVIINFAVKNPVAYASNGNSLPITHDEIKDLLVPAMTLYEEKSGKLFIMTVAQVAAWVAGVLLLYSM